MWNKNRKLILVEINEPNHSSLIRSWMHVLNRTDCQVQIATLNNIFDELDTAEQKFTMIFNNSFSLYIWIFGQVFRRNLIVILTYQTKWLPIFLLALTNKTIITVHNVNNWFCEKPKNLHLKNYIKYKLRRMVLRKSLYIAVNSANMKSYMKKQFGVTGKNVFVVPFNIARHKVSDRKQFKQDIFITYPGKLSTERKQYDKFIALAKYFPNEKFCILGRSDPNSSIYKQACKLDNIILFSQRVDKVTFDEIILRSKFLFSDFKNEIEVSGFLETYGLSKDSGVSYISYKYRKHIMLNRGFENIIGLEKAVLPFESLCELKSICKNLMSDNIKLNYPEKILEPDFEVISDILTDNRLIKEK